MGEAVLWVLLHFLYIFIGTLATGEKGTGDTSKNCLEPNVEDLEDYLSGFDFTNVPTVEMMIGGFKCPVTSLPFGALRSDWSRLILLQNAQPERSILKEKLERFFRILVIAYYQMEERFDVKSPETQSSRQTSSKIPTSLFVTTTNRAFEESANCNYTSSKAKTKSSAEDVPKYSASSRNGVYQAFKHDQEGLGTPLSLGKVGGRSNKIQKPTIFNNLPTESKFRKYDLQPHKFNLTAKINKKQEASDWRRKLLKLSRKRGSPNVDVEKIFKLFYSLGIKPSVAGEIPRNASMNCAG